MGAETGAAFAALLERCFQGALSETALVGDMQDMFGSAPPLLAGVTGWPLTYTRSPLIHMTWCRQHHVKGLYLRLPLAPDRFAEGIRLLQRIGFRGLNVTIPHKETAFALADRHTRAAHRAGAVNTLVFGADGSITGDCTDGTGYVASLRQAGIGLPREALVLGAGGASRAICAALLDVGCTVTLANRTRARAEALCEALQGGTVIDWQDWPDHLGRVGLLVNTTSLGMTGQDPFDWMPRLSGAGEDLVVSDIVYVPLQTPLLAAARARGLATVDGLGMLIHQAQPGFEAWFGVVPEIRSDLRQKILETLN